MDSMIFLLVAYVWWCRRIYREEKRKTSMGQLGRLHGLASALDGPHRRR